MAIFSLAFGLIGLVLGLVGWFLPFSSANLLCVMTGYLPIAALVSIMTGHEARTRLRAGTGPQTGGRLALAGLIFGYMIVVMVGLFIVWVFLTTDWSQLE